MSSLYVPGRPVLGGGPTRAVRTLKLPKPIPPPVVFDSFTDTAGVGLDAHVGEVGALWTMHPVSAVSTPVVSDRAQLRTAAISTTVLWVPSGAPATDEYDVECNFILWSGNSNIFSGIYARLDPVVQTGYLARYNNASTRFELARVNAGTLTMLGTSNLVLSGSRNYKVKLEVRNASKKLYVDGELLVSDTTDNTITGGKPGIRFFDGQAANGTGLHLDQFLVRNP